MGLLSRHCCHGLAAAATLCALATCTADVCDPIEQANCVAGASHLKPNQSAGTVAFLGCLASEAQCAAACSANSTASDPCRSWAFVWPDSPQEFRCNCFGRHDNTFRPVRNIPRDVNVVSTGINCEFPPPGAECNASRSEGQCLGENCVWDWPTSSCREVAPPSPPGPHSPSFSWDRVPTYNFPCFDPQYNISGPFDNSRDLSLLTKFPLVILCHGYYDDHGQLVKAEPAMTHVAQELKRNKPEIKVLFYKNSVLDWNDYEFHDKLLQRPDIWTRTETGAPTRTPGDKEFRQPAAGMLSVDFSQQAGRRFFSEVCTNATRGIFDGCFVDRAGSLPKDLSHNRITAYAQGHRATLQQLQLQIQHLAPGGTLVANNAFIQGVRSTMLESFAPSNASITQLREGVSRNVSVLAHGGYHEDCEHMSNGTLAAFLIGAGPNSYYACTKAWTFRTGWNVWYPEYSRPLGPPSPAVYNATTATWKREFGGGQVKVSFDATRGTGAIDWGPTPGLRAAEAT